MEAATIVDIAKLAGVSVSTVSRVLNNHPDVSPATKERVQEIIQAYSYIPNNSARSLKRESNRAVAVIVKGLGNPFFTGMIPILQQQLEDARYMMLLHQVRPEESEVDAALSFCKEKKPRGVIFMGGNFLQNTEKLSMLGVPYVMLTIAMQGGDREHFSSLSIDDFQAAYDVTEYACKSGHSHVAAMGFNEAAQSISRLRIEGFQAALRVNGCEATGSVVYAGGFDYADGYQAAKELLNRQKITCLFCISDILALGAIRAIHDAGYRIPEDISVIGFDGITEGRYAIPSLATVKQPGEKMALDSVKLLLDILRGKRAHMHRLYQTQVVDGESFAPRTHSNGTPPVEDKM